MTAAVEALHKLAPDDPTVLGNIARVLFDHGDPAAARDAYKAYLAKADKLPAGERGVALYRMGESARRAGDLEGATAPLLEAVDLDPASSLPLSALSRSTRSRATGRRRSRRRTAA